MVGLDVGEWTAPSKGVLRKYERKTHKGEPPKQVKRHKVEPPKQVKRKKSVEPTRIKSEEKKRKSAEEQIHSYEYEAYKAVIRAFCAQADNLSWAKAHLMAELKHALNISETVHKDLVLRSTNDDVVQKIRELKNAAEEPPQIQHRAPTAVKKMKKIDDDSHKGSGVMKKLNHTKPKKSKTEELTSIEALRNELARLERDPDPSRLALAKKVAQGFKAKLLEALDRCGPEEEDSEKTEEEHKDMRMEED